ncbi:MAG TPA: hypothetical protein PKJ95_05855, partial [Atribacterota bacterium]|nr:hypothetical protein [Atribacterota bacterium]
SGKSPLNGSFSGALSRGEGPERTVTHKRNSDIKPFFLMWSSHPGQGVKLLHHSPGICNMDIMEDFSFLLWNNWMT